VSIQITAAQKQQYASNFVHLAQQKMSRLRNAVMLETGVVGVRTSVDQIGQTAARKKTARHADTPIVNTPHSRRWINLFDYEWADYVDQLDKLKTIADPTNPYAQQAAMAMGRGMDDEIISAAFATAVTGENGESTVAFPASNIVAVNSWAFGTGSGDAGLTVSKTIEAGKILNESDVDPDEEKFLACGSEQIANMLATTEATSADYSNVKALMEGKIDTFMGFKFIRTERLLLGASSHRRVLAWCKSGLCLAVGQDTTVDIGPRRDKSMATQVFASMRIGASRVEEAKVVEILCDEV
jgi:hypothetical protein